jgi:ABC-type glycerol-3-phosphate transport system substrate-binding protein
MRFPLGKPVLAMILLALLSAGLILIRPTPERADLTVWCFNDIHASVYRDAPPGGESLVDEYRRRFGQSVSVELIQQRAEDARLVSLFMSDAHGMAVPDLCEIEIGSLGKFLRPAPDQIGLLPLNAYLQKSGWQNQILNARLMTWSKQGKIFAVPHDVHPVTITYRKDLFDQAGVDLESAATWPVFQEKCLQFQNYWARHGNANRHAIELHVNSADQLYGLLLQRHVNILDERNQSHLSDSKVAATIAFYAQLVAGPGQIGAETSPAPDGWLRDMERGEVAAIITPDWRASYLPREAPMLAGKLRMMSLPKFDEGDSPTTTMGGTGIGIPRNCKNPDAAWKLLEFLYLSREGNAARLGHGDLILPPVPEYWTDPIYARGDPYFGGQKVEQLYIDLARQIPPQTITPFTGSGQVALTLVLNKAVRKAESGEPPRELEADCAGWLNQASDELRQYIHFGESAP